VCIRCCEENVVSFLTRTALFLAMLSILTAQVAAHAQSDAPTIEGDLPIESYLSLLSQVSPAAREGAEAYMAAFSKRCGRALQTVELRRAFAQGSGDPTLMAMVRAIHQKDTAAVQRLGATINCPRG
jgi:hypothetical protein